MDVEVAAPKSLRHGRHGPKFTMSSAPSETTCGTPAAPAAFKPVRPGGKHPSDQLVGELGGGQVEDTGEEPSVTRFSIDCPPVPVAGRRGPRNPLFQSFPGPGHPRGRDPEHRGPDQGPVLHRGGSRVGGTMPAIAPAALLQDAGGHRLIPAMSTTEYIIVTSTAPT